MENAPPIFRLALILGGARSGKSRYGLGLAARCPAPRLFVATCEPRDAEMEARIEAHQRERGSDWSTREVPLDLADAVSEAQDHYGVILVDCLTMWVSNLLLQEGAPPGSIQTACERLLEGLAKTAAPTILVSNEVGWGIVPDNPPGPEVSGPGRLAAPAPGAGGGPGGPGGGGGPDAHQERVVSGTAVSLLPP